ncbi:hypothetical protein MNB_SV-15-634 [hydrothermal vent metagenome]|uniref:Uncharacterized protein n=1 Tax=hydrothermal vent metagenome TaxID=652676 RepID=A0A1W1EHH9_9ZZZZ
MGIESKFKKVFLEIESLEKKINNGEYRSFFKSKKYNINSLMSNRNYQNIYNFTRTIGDNITSLCSSEDITKEEIKIYRRERNRLDAELHRIHLIMENDKRFWKNSREVFEEFQYKIMMNLPFELNQNIWKIVKRFFFRLFATKPIYLKLQRG